MILVLLVGSEVPWTSIMVALLTFLLQKSMTEIPPPPLAIPSPHTQVALSWDPQFRL